MPFRAYGDFFGREKRDYFSSLTYKFSVSVKEEQNRDE